MPLYTQRFTANCFSSPRVQMWINQPKTLSKKSDWCPIIRIRPLLLCLSFKEWADEYTLTLPPKTCGIPLLQFQNVSRGTASKCVVIKSQCVWTTQTGLWLQQHVVISVHMIKYYIMSTCLFFKSSFLQSPTEKNVKVRKYGQNQILSHSIQSRGSPGSAGSLCTEAIVQFYSIACSTPACVLSPILPGSLYCKFKAKVPRKAEDKDQGCVHFSFTWGVL